jgi:hypothetical protein
MAWPGSLTVTIGADSDDDPQTLPETMSDFSVLSDS